MILMNLIAYFIGDIFWMSVLILSMAQRPMAIKRSNYMEQCVTEVYGATQRLQLRRRSPVKLSETVFGCA